jgi:hypothetical protein
MRYHCATPAENQRLEEVRLGPPNPLLLLVQGRREPERNVCDSDLIDRHQVYLIILWIENREQIGQSAVTHFNRPVARLTVGVKEQDIVFDRPVSCIARETGASNRQRRNRTCVRPRKEPTPDTRRPQKPPGFWPRLDCPSLRYARVQARLQATFSVGTEKYPTGPRLSNSTQGLPNSHILSPRVAHLVERGDEA